MLGEGATGAALKLDNDSVDLCEGLLQGHPAIHNEGGLTALFCVGELSGQNHFELLGRHAGSFQHTGTLHLGGCADHQRHVAAAGLVGLEKQRVLEDRHRGATARGGLEAFPLSLVNEGMNNGFKAFEAGGVLQQLGGEAGTIDTAVSRATRKGGLDRGHCKALVELVDESVGVAYGEAQLAKAAGYGGFAHADRAGKTNDEHFDVSLSCIVYRGQRGGMPGHSDCAAIVPARDFDGEGLR